MTSCSPDLPRPSLPMEGRNALNSCAYANQENLAADTVQPADDRISVSNSAGARDRVGGRVRRRRRDEWHATTHAIVRSATSQPRAVGQCLRTISMRVRVATSAGWKASVTWRWMRNLPALRGRPARLPVAGLRRTP